MEVRVFSTAPESVVIFHEVLASFLITDNTIIMCLDFNKLDISELKSEIPSILNAGNKCDPVFGLKDKSALLHSNGTVKHGFIIEKTIIKIIRASKGWGVTPQFRISGKRKNYFLDHVVCNNSRNRIYVLECKRNLSNASKEKIEEYINLTSKKATQLCSACGTDKKKTRIWFLVFDAYGDYEKESYYNLPARVIKPKHLPYLFNSCVAQGWQALEKEVYDVLQSKELPIDENFRERVGKYPRFEELEANGDSQICDVEDNRERDKIVGEPLWFGGSSSAREFIP